MVSIYFIKFSRYEEMYLVFTESILINTYLINKFTIIQKMYKIQHQINRRYNI